MIGQTISHYKILEELGAGGMGVVYKAEDTKLDRPVALKFLPPELTRDPDAKKRFAHEAKAASALQHHNICTIHEIDETKDGQMFISMDCYEGEALKERIARGPLPVAEAIDIAIQVSEGLSKAHEAGMVHRDIKPANIMITSDGIVKILDFGLAKLAGQTRVTKTGTTVGTVAYMSPEQAQGEEIDERTDIWSLGVVLYELLTGQLPFRGEHEIAIVYGIINTDPDSLTGYDTEFPGQLQEIVDKCLAKGKDERYAVVSQLIADLHDLRDGVKLSSPKCKTWVFGGGNAPRNPRRIAVVAFAVLGILILAVIGLNIANLRVRIIELAGIGDTAISKSLAILPFENLGADPETDYLSDEIPASIINNLSQLSHLRVIPRSSAFYFKNRQDDLKNIGDRLKVGTILTGQIKVRGDQVSIRAELIDIDIDRQLWGDRYTGTLDDIMSTEEEIVAKISDALKLRLTDKEQDRIAKQYSVSPKAHRLYLKGRYYWNKRNKEDFFKAIDCFEQAIDESPDYALPYAGIAETYALFVDYAVMPPEDAYPRAKAAARKAIEIDRQLAEPYTALGYVLTFGDWDWQGAESHFKQAIDINPNYANAHHWYAMLLYTTGRSDEALAEIDKAMEIDPLSLIIKTTKGWVYYTSRCYDKALNECLEALEMDPDFLPTRAILGKIYCQKEMYEEAIAVLKTSSQLIDYLAVAYALAGMEIEARQTLEKLNKLEIEGWVLSSALVAMFHMGLGDADRAFEYLEQAFKNQDFYLPSICVDPVWDPLRNDPRFSDLVARLGLETALAK